MLTAALRGGRSIGETAGFFEFVRRPEEIDEIRSSRLRRCRSSLLFVRWNNIGNRGNATIVAISGSGGIKGRHGKLSNRLELIAHG